MLRKDLQYVSDTFHLPDEFLHKIWRKSESNIEACSRKNCPSGKPIHITYTEYVPIKVKVKVNQSLYMPGVAQRVPGS
jgi:hypothetical protein